MQTTVMPGIDSFRGICSSRTEISDDEASNASTDVHAKAQAKAKANRQSSAPVVNDEQSLMVESDDDEDDEDDEIGEDELVFGHSVGYTIADSLHKDLLLRLF